MRLIDLTGRRFGRLVVDGRAPNGGRHVYWQCRCDCGAERQVKGDHLKAGSTVSCGCHSAETARARLLERGAPDRTTHGHAAHRAGLRTPEYVVWSNMIQRATNANHPAWDNYGGRGITVCDRWRSYENFLSDMGARPEGLTLDRIDVDGNYEPGNCRWATWAVQRQNQRRMSNA